MGFQYSTSVPHCLIYGCNYIWIVEHFLVFWTVLTIHLFHLDINTFHSAAKTLHLYGEWLLLIYPHLILHRKTSKKAVTNKRLSCILCVQIPVVMTWKGREATDVIAWFQYECDPSLNSNVFQVASYVVQKHFPGNCFPCHVEILFRDCG